MDSTRGAFKYGLFLSAAAVAVLVTQEEAKAETPTPVSYSQLTLPVYDGQTPVATIRAWVSPTGQYRVETTSILSALRNVFGEAQFAELTGKIGSTSQITSENAADFGIGLQFDTKRVAFQIVVPADMRGVTELELVGLGKAPAPTRSRKEEADFSGYLNISSGINRDPFLQSNDTQVLTFLESSLSLGGFVLENSAVLEFGSDEDAKFSRQATRLTKDFAGLGVRAAVGDLFTTTDGFVPSDSILGLSIFRNVDIFDPYQTSRPTGRQSFVLEEAAEADIYVNGALLQQTYLQPGQYDLTNFPLADGSNDVRLELRDTLGQLRVLEFTSFFDSELLAPGISQWEFSAGVPSIRANREVEYNFDDFAVSALYRRGVSNELTLGVSGRATRDEIIAGGEVVAATGVGNMSVDFAASQFDDRTGGAARITYRPLFGLNSDTGGGAVDLFAEYATRDFSSNVLSSIAQELRAGFRYSDVYLENKLAVTASLNYTSAYDVDADGFEASLGLGYRFENDLTLRVTPNYRQTLGDQKEVAVRVSLSKSFGARSRARATYDSRENRQLAEYDYRSQYSGIGTWGANVVASRANDQSDTFSTVADYTANRFEASLGYAHEFDEDRAGSLGRIRANVGTSLAFADGSFAIGRPIRDSFAIVKPHETLKGRDIVVAPGGLGRGDEARSGALGPALVPDLSPYSLSRLPYDIPDLPAGYDYGTGILEYLPSYHAGYATTVGSNRSASAIGYIFYDTDNPLALGVGEATSETDEEFETQRIFTNRTGRFGVLGLVPGNEYELVFPEDGITAEITIPADAEGFVDVGRIYGEKQ